MENLEKIFDAILKEADTSKEQEKIIRKMKSDGKTYHDVKKYLNQKFGYSNDDLLDGYFSQRGFK